MDITFYLVVEMQIKFIKLIWGNFIKFYFNLILKINNNTIHHKNISWKIIYLSINLIKKAIQIPLKFEMIPSLPISSIKI